jgi:hypothetical protein
MIEKLYIMGLIIISVWVLYLYITNEQDHRKELEKIEYLEKKRALKERELEMIRSQTKECPIAGLDSPRKCYFDSGYTCTWNDAANRCDKKL